MFKKFGIGILVTLVLVAAAVGVVAAQEDVPLQEGVGKPLMEMFGGGRGGMRGGRGGMGGGQQDVIAEALGMTAEDLQAAIQEGKTVADIAGEQGVALDSVVAAVMAGAQEQVTQAVEDGKLTQEEADAKLVEMEERLTESFTEGFPTRPEGERPEGKGGMGGGQQDVIAEALGLTAEDLQAAIQEGKTVADVASEQGVALDSVVAAVMADAQEHVAQAVEDGKLTQEEADAKLVEMEERLTESFTEGFPTRPEGGRSDSDSGFGGMRGGRPSDGSQMPDGANGMRGNRQQAPASDALPGGDA